jgi:hypothetical protein
MVVAVFLVGCANYDWASEVGNYTLDDAKVEFGPPDNITRLDNGGTVAMWIVNQRTVEPRKRILRFDENGKLTSGVTEQRSR